jgi:dehydrogenase/reductase SDR family protein 12
MSSMKDIRQLADYFLKNEKMLNILVNNAGTMINKRELTSEGIEKNFATNTLGTYYLTKLMIPLLKLSNPAKVITVSSGGMLTEPLKLKDLMAEHDFDGTKQYAINKRHQVALTEYWTKCYTPHGVHFYTMHPGWADTDGVR